MDKKETLNMTDIMLEMEKKVTPMKQMAHADRYTGMARAWLAGAPLKSPSGDSLLMLRDQLALEYPQATKLQGEQPSLLSNRWEELRQLCRNPAFYWFMREWAHTSPIGTEWVLDVHRTDPRTLEVAFGYGWEFEEPERLTRIHRHDPYWWWAVATPTFHEARVRARKAADLLEATKSRASVNRPARALIVGAGRVPELRYAGFTFEPERLEITALDKSPEFNLEKLFFCEAPDPVFVKTGGGLVLLPSFVTQHGLAELGVREVHNSIQSYLMQAIAVKAEPFDLIVMNGLAIHLGEDLPAVLRTLCSLLKPGGKLFFDYSFPSHWDLVRSVMVYGWGLPSLPESEAEHKKALRSLMQSFASAPETPEEVVRIAKLAKPDRSFACKVEVDEFCDPPVAVYVTITR